MIQDIAPHHFDNAYHSYAPREEDFAIYCQPHQVLLKRQEDRIIFPTFQDLKKRNDDILENATYLFQIDEFRFFLVKTCKPGTIIRLPDGKHRNLPSGRTTISGFCRNHCLPALSLVRKPEILRLLRFPAPATMKKSG